MVRVTKRTYAFPVVLGTETCAVVEIMASLEQDFLDLGARRARKATGKNGVGGGNRSDCAPWVFSLRCVPSTGDPSLMDRVERLAFNALPAALTDDMWANVYDSRPSNLTH